MKNCLRNCKIEERACSEERCRYWIDYESELNCTFESINIHGVLSVKQISERLQIPLHKVRSLEKSGIKKIKKHI